MGVYLWTDDSSPNEYTYDFRGKTVSQVQNDGWTTVSNFTCDADGAYSSDMGDTTMLMPLSLSDAVSIEMIVGIYNMNYGNFAFTTRDTASSGHETGVTFSGPVSDGAYFIGGSFEHFSETLSSGAGEFKINMDLVNKTFVMTYQSDTWSDSISSSELTGIRSNKYFSVGVPTSMARLQYIKYKVGY